MNKEFVRKIIKAKKLEYEALKEIMPESITSRITSVENEAISLIKDIALELIQDEVKEKKEAEPVKRVKNIGIK